MIILLSVTTYSGTQLFENSKLVKFVKEMQIIQGKVDEIYKQVKRNELNVNTLGSALSSSQVNTLNNIKTKEIGYSIIGNTNDFRYFSYTALQSELEVDNINQKNSVFINFITREVVSENGIKYKGTTYYTQYHEDVLNGQILIQYANNISAPTFTYTVKNFGLTAKVEVTTNAGNVFGALYYHDVDGNTDKTVTSKAIPGETYEANITKTGEYVFKLKNADGSETTQNINIVLANNPKLEEGDFTGSDLRTYANGTKQNAANDGTWYDYSKTSQYWAYAESGGKIYVWLPRFAKNGAYTIFVKGNTNVPTTNNSLAAGYGVLEEFNPGGNKLTGIWLDVTSENKMTLDLTTII